MKISHVRVVDLTESELTRCRELSYGDEGYMCEDLDEILDIEQGWRYRYSQAVLLRESSEIIGWALIRPIYRSKRYSVQLFVDPYHRRKGHGSALLTEAYRWGVVPMVFIDKDNVSFFKNYTEKYETKLEFA